VAQPATQQSITQRGAYRYTAAILRSKIMDAPATIELPSDLGLPITDDNLRAAITDDNLRAIWYDDDAYYAVVEITDTGGTLTTTKMIYFKLEITTNVQTFREALRNLISELLVEERITRRSLPWKCPCGHVEEDYPTLCSECELPNSDYKGKIDKWQGVFLPGDVPFCEAQEQPIPLSDADQTKLDDFKAAQDSEIQTLRAEMQQREMQRQIDEIQQQQPMIPENEIEVDSSSKVIGEGGFGRVIQGKKRTDGNAMDVAIKVLKVKNTTVKQQVSVVCGVVYGDQQQVSGLQVQRSIQIYSSSGYCLVAFCTWNPTTRRNFYES
jgi:hypothetical protein